MGLRNRDPRQHPWWEHVPTRQRTATLRRRRWHLLKAALSTQRTKIAVTLLAYGAFTLAIASSGVGAMGAVTLVPLVVLPALAGLAWWLTWKDFHH
jgi:hypothetical protein